MEENINRNALPVPADFDLQNDFFARHEYLKKMIIKEQIQHNARQPIFSRGKDRDKSFDFITISLFIVIASLFVSLIFSIVKKASTVVIIILSILLALSVGCYALLLFIKSKKSKPTLNSVNISKYALQQLEERIERFTQALYQFFNNDENRVNDELNKYKTNNYKNNQDSLYDISLRTLNLKSKIDSYDLLNYAQQTSKNPASTISEETNKYKEESPLIKTNQKSNADFSKFKVTAFGNKNTPGDTQQKNSINEIDKKEIHTNDNRSNVIERKVIIHDEEFNNWLKNNK